MAFQEIDPVDSAEFYLDMAFKKCTKRSSFKKVPKRSTKFDKIKTLEISKVDSFHGILVSKLTSIVEMFPKLDDLTDFYVELVKITLGIREYKHALYNVSWSSKKLDSFFSGYIGRLKGAKNLSSLHKVKNEFFGRCSSVMKSLKKDFIFLGKARVSLQSFPVIRQRLKQVAIAGFPNVGKSTLLSKLSASKPEIASYPFTTKKTMIGYVSKNNVKTTQLLDTPGTLNRADKMNFIEQQAYLIMKMVAEKIIFVFDLTEPYPLEDQIKLYKRIKLLKKPMVVYLSKTDILKKDKYADFQKEFSAVSDFNDLKNFI